MKHFLFSFLIASSLYCSESASALEEVAKEIENVSKSLDKVEKKNQELIELNKEKNVKLQKLEFVHKKVNEQNKY